MCRGTFSACGGSRKRHSSIPPQCDPRGAFLSYGNEVSNTIIKNVPWHILAPRRGCFSNHLPLRRVRILAERLLSYGNEVSYTMNKNRILQRRILRLRRVAYATFSSPPQCDPRGAFLSYGNEVSYTMKKNRQL